MTSCEMLHTFYKWFADEVEDIPEGYTMVRTSFPHISEMAYYHGYVSKTEWNDGYWVPGDFNHGFTVRKQTQQQVKASRSSTAQGSEDYWFSDKSTGNHKPLQYNTEAVDAIAKFITESVAANSKGACRDLRSYFDTMPRQPVDTGDLYDSP